MGRNKKYILEKQTTNITNNLLNIAFGNGMWVAVGASGIILTSNNGISWVKME